MVDQYAEKYGLVVPYSTVAEWMRKARGTSRRDFAWQIPWQLPEGSFTPRQLRRLRWLYRYDNGGTLSESQRREVAALLRLLEPTVGGREFADLIRSRRTELVLEYVAKSGRWEYVRRRPQIDLGWVREPWWNDLGELRSVTELREMGVRESLLTDFVESGVPLKRSGFGAGFLVRVRGSDYGKEVFEGAAGSGCSSGDGSVR